MQNMFYINICVDTQKFKQQNIYMNEQKAKEIYCLSRLTEGPKDISPPFITLNILLGNFLVCPVCQVSLGEYGTKQCH